MEPRQIVLKLFLDALGISSDIDTVNDRKRVQKAIYLGQLTGVDLGYRFGWYLKGPYSPSLTKDYFALEEALASGDREHDDKELNKSIIRKLRKALPLMEPPKEVHLSQEDWLELVSSLHFLREVQGLNNKDCLRTLKREKTRLAKYFDQAEEALQKVSLLS